MANQDILLGDGPTPHASASLKILFFSFLFQIKFKNIDRLLWLEQIDFNGKIVLQEISKEFYKSPQKCNMFRSLTSGKGSGWLHRKAHKLVLCTFPGSRPCFTGPLLPGTPHSHNAKPVMNKNTLWKNSGWEHLWPCQIQEALGEQNCTYCIFSNYLQLLSYLTRDPSFSSLPTLKWFSRMDPFATYILLFSAFSCS